MKLIIDIPTFTYLSTKRLGRLSQCNDNEIAGWIIKGVPLEQETDVALKDVRQDISNELERMYMYRDYANGLGKAIMFIDKRIAESEVENGNDIT